jgi:hypothetical protein
MTTKHKALISTQTAVVSVAALGAVTLLMMQAAGSGQLIWMALICVLGLAVVMSFGFLISAHRADVEQTGSEQYRRLADEYRRLADLATVSQEHIDLKLGELSAQLDYLREQSDSLRTILKEVE